MNFQETLKELSKQLGPPRTRAAFGSWVPLAWVVRGLTEQGYGVTEAVKQVLEKSGFANNPQAFGSLRAALYKVKTKEWPAEFSNKAARKAKKETGDVEGFE